METAGSRKSGVINQAPIGRSMLEVALTGVFHVSILEQEGIQNG